MKIYAATALLVFMGAALSAHPALSQSAMGKGPAPGGPAIAPQPRMSPTSPGTGTPLGRAAEFGEIRIPIIQDDLDLKTNRGPNGGSTSGGGAAGDSPTHTDPTGVLGCLPDKCAAIGKTSSVGPKQEPSKAPLPSGYAYDANGRIGFVGTAGTESKTAGGQQKRAVVQTGETGILIMNDKR